MRGLAVAQAGAGVAPGARTALGGGLGIGGGNVVGRAQELVLELKMKWMMNAAALRQVAHSSILVG